MTPSVGRIVHYVSRGSADGVYPAACRAAIVTEVADENQVSLVVFNIGLYVHEDTAHNEDKVPGTWHWPEQVS